MKKLRRVNETRGSADQLLTEVGLLFASGDIGQAESILRGMLEQNPRETRALVALGIMAGQTGKLQPALALLGQALDLEPRNVSILCWMSFFHMQLGQFADARRFAEQAVSLNPRDAASLGTVARCLAQEGRHSESIAFFQKAVELDPNNPTLMVEFADASLAVRNWNQARELMRKAVLVAPDTAYLLKLAHLELRQGNDEEAERFCRRALRKDSNLAAAHLLMARILTEQLRLDEAEVHWRRTAELEPEEGHVNLEKALSLRAIGQFSETIDELMRSIELKPIQGIAYQALVFAKRIGTDDMPLVRQMEGLLADNTLSDGARVNLLYSVGKSYDNLGDFERANALFDRANELRKQVEGFRPFDRVGFTALIDARIKLFSSGLYDHWKYAGSDSALPLLVVGMMRSGTTLVEQMLTCHPQIGGAGEQDYWGEAEVLKAESIDPTKVRGCAAEYQSLLKAIAPGFPHVIDKNPANLQYLGSVHLSLPNARIIHTRRNAIDTALSIWMTPMNTSAEFVCDRADIVFAYKECLRLMDHWRKVLPSDRFMEIQYEDLVNEPEVHAPRIVEFCGLQWDPACLHPELNERRVRTPSVWQVRQPIYKSSTERWKKYEPWLGVFEELKGL